MRFLLVSISLLFSFIFYVFYTASIGKNIFFQNSENIFFGKTIFSNFLVFPLLFLFLAVFFYFYFMSKNKKTGPVLEKWYSNTIKASFLLGWILFWVYYFLSEWYIYILLLYFFPVITYFLLYFLYIYKKISQKIYISSNIISIIFWYFSTFVLIFTVLFQSVEKNITSTQQLFFYIWICCFAIFHIYIHIRHDNLISLVIWTITGIFSLYSIFLMIIPWII